MTYNPDAYERYKRSIRDLPSTAGFVAAAEQSRTVRQHTACRVCGAPLGAPYLDLGEQPLANALVPNGIVYDTDDTTPVPLVEHRFPLQVVRCAKCHLSQLTVVVDPKVLYSGYRFRSGTSEAWVKHCEALAAQCSSGEWGEYALDIAANDGTMLYALMEGGWRVTGVDPSPCDPNPINGPRIIPEAWSGNLAARLAKDQYPFDLIIAQNVLGHVDDPIDFLKGIALVLSHEGRAIIEVPHVGDLLYAGAFDTIYHEHLSYWHLRPLRRAAAQAGLDVVKVERLTIHGGSRRYWLALQGTAPIEQSVTDESVMEWELKLHQTQPFTDFAAMTAKLIDETEGLAVLCNKRGRMVAWGASAKCAVMLNCLQDRRALPESVIDDTVEKQGMLMPGVHVPIISAPESLADVSTVWITSWNNADAIKAKAEALGFRGVFLVSHGEPRLEDA